MLTVKTKKVLHYLLPLLLVLPLTFLYIKVVFAETAVGAVNNWINLTGGTYLSVDMTPNYGEFGYHFYSLSTYFQAQGYGLYSGIQTNGNLGSGGDVGNIFLFSVWNATEAYPENGSTATPFGGEGVGYSLRKQYDWVVGKTYTIKIQREAYDATKSGYRWSASITDKEAGTTLKIGEILSPPGAAGLASGSAFHERFVGSNPSCTASTSNLEKASVTFDNLSSDKTVSFTGTSSPNNIFTSSSCSSFIHWSNSGSRVVTGFGITQAEFDDVVNPPVQNDSQGGSSEESGGDSGSSNSSSDSSSSNSVSSSASSSDASGTEQGLDGTQDQISGSANTEETVPEAESPSASSAVSKGFTKVQTKTKEAIQDLSNTVRTNPAVKISAGIAIPLLGASLFTILKFHLIKL